MTKQNSEKGGLGTKAVIIIIAAVMLSAALVPFTYDMETDDAWSGTLSYSGTGFGTVGDPYIITTAAQLDEIRDDLGAHYRLGSDIDLDVAPYNAGWTPIGTSGTPFTGSLDGDGYTIYRLNIPASTSDHRGLFGYVAGGSIIDLVIKESSISGRDYVGGIVGYITGGSITDSGIEESSVSGRNYVGGIAGYMRSSEISYSYNAATVYGSGFRIGGIAGQVYDQSVVSFCYNIGAVSGDTVSTGSNSIGGIAGIVNGITVSSRSVVVNCYNLGHVTGTRVGGVVGQLNFAVLANCYNAGTVNGSNVGGVVGYMITSNIYNVYNTGDVSTDSTGGFIVGSFSGVDFTKPENANLFYLEDEDSIAMPNYAIGSATAFGLSFDGTGELATTDKLLDAMNTGASSAPAALGVTCGVWIESNYPILQELSVKVSLIHSDNGTASISPAEEHLAKGTAFTVTVAPGTDCIEWTVKDNGVSVLDDTDATFTYEFVAHKGHLIDVSFKVEETGPVIGPIPDPDVKGGNVSATFLVILAALIIFGVLFIGWLYKRRKDEEDPK